MLTNIILTWPAVYLILTCIAFIYGIATGSTKPIELLSAVEIPTFLILLLDVGIVIRHINQNKDIEPDKKYEKYLLTILFNVIYIQVYSFRWIFKKRKSE